MSVGLSNMAFGDIRICSFLWGNWLFGGDSITGTPVITATAPLTYVANSVSVTGSTVEFSVQAGSVAGTGEVSCTVLTTLGAEATRTVLIPVVAFVPQ